MKAMLVRQRSKNDESNARRTDENTSVCFKVGISWIVLIMDSGIDIEFQPMDIILDFALRRVGTVLIFCLCEKIKVVTSERYCCK